MIKNPGVCHEAAVIDFGGGNSTLVDDLLGAGFVDVSVSDISANAIKASKERLGTKAYQVDWIVADITAAGLLVERFDVWHDRAVFSLPHDADDRRKFVELVMPALNPGGHIIVASFGLDGPQKCSGLDVMRYSPATIHGEFGSPLMLIPDKTFVGSSIQHRSL